MNDHHATGGQFRSWWRPYWCWSGRGRLPAFEIGVRRTITREYLEIEDESELARPRRVTLEVPDVHCLRLELQ